MAENIDTGKGGVSDLSGRRVFLLFPHMVHEGGALAYTLRLSKQLHERGATVGILAMQADCQAFDMPAGVEVVCLDGPLTSSLGYWLLLPYWQGRINRAIAAWRPDVLVPQVFPANWWGWLYKRKRPDMKLVWICQEPSAFIHSQAWILSLRPWWKSLLARILRPVLGKVDVSLQRYCDRTVANSRFTAGEMKRIYGTAPDTIAHPGIDFQNFVAESRPKERAVMTVARMTKFKRVDFLLEVFAQAVKLRPDLTFFIVGTGEDETLLQKQAARLGLKSQVVFCGAVDSSKLSELYRRSSLYLHGSVGEPFGMAPLEAIACGTPVVAHNSGGPTEFVTGECGRLVNSLEVKDWAGAVEACLADLSAGKMPAEQVRRCAQSYDWALTLQPAIDMISGLLKRN